MNKLKKKVTSKKLKEDQADLKRRRSIVQETIIPFLAKHTKNANDARRVLATVRNFIDVAFQESIKKEQLRYSQDVDLNDLAWVGSTKALKENKLEAQLLELVKAEKTNVAQSIIGGCLQLIEGKILAQVDKQTLEELVK